MSHVAELPDERFPFRFYIHDPWFMNSPWLDRYGREPWDLFQPLSIGRIDGKGRVSMANSVAMLSVDDTWGRMPDQVPREVIPLRCDTAVSGDVTIENRMPGDCYQGASPAATAHILPQFACGGLVEVPAENAASKPCAWAVRDGVRRVAALRRTLENGAEIGFVRAILPSAAEVKPGRGFDYGSRTEIYPTPRLMRDLLAEFGWKMRSGIPENAGTGSAAVS